MNTPAEHWPWSVPVPIQTGRFVSLFPEHAALNVQTAQLPAFDSRPEPWAEDSLLYADLQSTLYMQIAGRLGSGRSGFHRGWYLKGVGRTPLAANWNLDDRLHNSGHLTASGAIREYIATLYARECGCAASIVPCEGLLFAELAPELRGYHDNLYRGADAETVPPVDRALQAISVKPGSFARQSNLLWLLHHLTPGTIDAGRSSLATFCELFVAALAPATMDSAPDVTPAGLVELLRNAVRRALDHFERWFTHGIWWGSFHNNFTLDGRFLDLETPALLGGPFVGRLRMAAASSLLPAQSSLIVAFDQLLFIAQTRTFCVEMVRVLRALPRSFHPIERDFASELAGHLQADLLAPQALLGSREQLLRRVIDMIEVSFGRLPAPDQAMLRRLLAVEYDRRLGDEDTVGDGVSAVHDEVRFSLVPGFPALLTEPQRRWRPAALTLASGRLLGPTEAQVQRAARWSELVADLDHTTSLAAMLDKLAAIRLGDPIVPPVPGA